MSISVILRPRTLWSFLQFNPPYLFQLLLSVISHTLFTFLEVATSSKIEFTCLEVNYFLEQTSQIVLFRCFLDKISSNMTLTAIWFLSRTHLKNWREAHRRRREYFIRNAEYIDFFWNFSCCRLLPVEVGTFTTAGLI